MSSWGGSGELYHYSVFARFESYWNVHVSFFCFQWITLQNLVYSNSEKKYSELVIPEKMKKSGLSKCKIKILKKSSSYNTLCDGSKLFIKLTLYGRLNC